MKTQWTNPLNIFALIVFVAVASYLTYGIYQNTRPELKATQATQVKAVAKPVDVPLNADKILELVNAERAKVGVAPLVSDPRLVQSAQTKADDMVVNNYFAHVNPVTGVNGYTLVPIGMCVYQGENISYHHKSNESVVAGWMGSTPHHDAMLDPKYTLTGMADANNDVVVQHFCQQ